MSRCDKCGNDYDKSFTIARGGTTHTFDSFECAIAMMAPECSHCHCRIIGHGLESAGKFYCCAHCATQAGIKTLRDRDDARAV
jgi:hypothetical protein